MVESKPVLSREAQVQGKDLSHDILHHHDDSKESLEIINEVRTTKHKQSCAHLDHTHVISSKHTTRGFPI